MYARQPRAGRYCVVALLFALALMAKPQVITFPCVLLLWDYWPLQRMFAGAGKQPVPETGAAVIPTADFYRLLREKFPLLALSAISAAITVAAQRAAEHSRRIRLPFGWRTPSFSYAMYVRDAFWPSPLAPFYPHPEGALAAKSVGGAGLSGWGNGGGDSKSTTTPLPVGGMALFLGTLVPMIGLVQVGNQARADRYAYLSFIGLFLMICWSVAEWLNSGTFLLLAGRCKRAGAVGAYRRDPSPDRILERQRHPVVAHAAGHQRQLHGGRQPGWGTNGARAIRRSHAALPRGPGIILPIRKPLVIWP